MLLLDGDTGAALALLEPALRERPANPQLNQLKLRALRDDMRLSEALAFAQNLPEQLRNDAFLLSLLGMLIDTGRLDAAQRLVDGACDPGETKPRCVIARARLAQARHGEAAALAVIDGSGVELAGKTGLINERIRLLLRLGRESEAAEMLLDDTQAGNALFRINALIDLGRIDEASVALGQCREAVGTQPEWFVAASKIDLARNDPQASLAHLKAAVARYPGRVALNALLWAGMVQTGDGPAAREACLRFKARHPDSAPAQLAVAQFLSGAQDTVASDDAFAQAGAVPGDRPQIAFTRANVLLGRKDALGALQALDAAEALAAGAERPLLRARILVALGEDSAAISLLEGILDQTPGNHEARLTLANLLVRNGAFDDARDQLALIPDGSSALAAKAGAALAEISIFEGSPGVALRGAEALLARMPGMAGPWRVQARSQLLLGRISAAWDSHCRATEILHGSDQAGTKSNKARNSLLGQILNEFRLFDSGDLAIWCGADADQRAAMRHFRSQIAENPSSTAHAIYLFSAMLRAGVIRDAPPPPPDGAERIPRQIFQFWDTPEPPAAIAGLMAEARDLNPGYTHRIFDQRAAAAYLREKGEVQALRGFQLARNPAGKADILRLAVLYHEGGIYIDADDRCVSGLDALVDHHLRFMGVQEQYMSLGNNFLAATPGDPILRAALDEAAVAFNGPSGESLWLSSGPGAITRAAALHGTNDDGSLASGVRILPTHTIRKIVAPHISVSYKTTDSYWIASFRRAESAAGTHSERAT